MLNDITIVECEVMSHLVRLRGKDTVQCAHCALEWMKKILQTELKLTCHEDGAKHEKAEDHLKPDLQTSAFGNPRWPP